MGAKVQAFSWAIYVLYAFYAGLLSVYYIWYYQSPAYAAGAMVVAGVAASITMGVLGFFCRGIIAPLGAGAGIVVMHYFKYAILLGTFTAHYQAQFYRTSIEAQNYLAAEYAIEYSVSETEAANMLFTVRREETDSDFCNRQEELLRNAFIRKAEHNENNVLSHDQAFYTFKIRYNRWQKWFTEHKDRINPPFSLVTSPPNDYMDADLQAARELAY